MSEIPTTAEAQNNIPEYTRDKSWLRKLGKSILGMATFDRRIEKSQKTWPEEEQSRPEANNILDRTRPEVARAIDDLMGGYKQQDREDDNSFVERVKSAQKLKDAIFEYDEDSENNRSPEYWKTLVRTERLLSNADQGYWIRPHTIKDILGKNEKTMAYLDSSLDKLEDTIHELREDENTSRHPDINAIETAKSLSETYVKEFNEKLGEDVAAQDVAIGWIGKISRMKIEKNPPHKDAMLNAELAFESSIKRLAFDGDEDGFDLFMSVYINGYSGRLSYNEGSNRALLLLQDYYLCAGIDSDELNIFNNRRTEINKNIPQDDILGDRIGIYSTSEWRMACMLERATPKNINELMQIYEMLPGSSSEKVKQNREDALTLERSGLIPAHEFIHEQAPKTHDTLEAMLNYYDSRGDSDRHEKCKTRLKEVINDVSTGLFAEMYTHEAPETIPSNGNEKVSGRSLKENLEYYLLDLARYENENAVNALRRLVKNTITDTLQKSGKQDKLHITNKSDFPITTDENLNARLASLNVSFSEDGRTTVDFNEVAILAQEMNDLLAKSQGEAVLVPNIMETVCYINRLADCAVKSKIETADLMQEPGFKEILKFNRLTASYDDYDSVAFDKFYANLFNKGRKRGDIVSDQKDAFAKLSREIKDQVGKLGKYYAVKGKDKAFLSGIASGNLTWTLMSLADKRSNSQKILAEMDEKSTAESPSPINLSGIMNEAFASLYKTHTTGDYDMGYEEKEIEPKGKI